MSKFDDYIAETGWSKEYECIARSAWNAAIYEAAKLVEEHYDSNEPWIEPYQIEQLQD